MLYLYSRYLRLSVFQQRAFREFRIFQVTEHSGYGFFYYLSWLVLSTSSKLFQLLVQRKILRRVHCTIIFICCNGCALVNRLPAAIDINNPTGLKQLLLLVLWTFFDANYNELLSATWRV